MGLGKLILAAGFVTDLGLPAYLFGLVGCWCRTEC